MGPPVSLRLPEDDERGRPEFTLAEVYGFEARLSAIYPGNNIPDQVRDPAQDQAAVAGAAGHGVARVQRAGDVSADVRPISPIPSPSGRRWPRSGRMRVRPVSRRKPSRERG